MDPNATPDPLITDPAGAGTATPAPAKTPSNAQLLAENAALKAALISQSAAGAASASVLPAVAGPLAGPALITRTDERNGLAQSLPQATWDLLSAEERALFDDFTATAPDALPTTPTV